MNPLQDRLQRALGASYRVERELGGGGMSHVFVAEEVALGRRVVVKVLPPELAAGVSAERFRREIQLAAQLQHPGIVPLLTAGADGDLLWYVMPFVEGESLRARLARGPLPVDEAVRLWRDLLEALEYAHGRGIVHRDIKPENIMLTGRRAVTLDFGVAKAVSASTSGGVTTTGVGFVVGTPAYMAPEQAAGDSNVDARADLYAAGLVMYEMLAGRGPFEARTPAEWMAAHIATPPTPIQSQRAEVASPLAELVTLCLAKDPAARPASVADVLARLESGPVVTTPQAPVASQQGASRRGALLGALLSIAVVAGGAFLVRNRSDTRDVSEARAIAELPDSARLQVAFLPVIADPQDSILARSLVSAQIRSLQDDRRVLLQTPERIHEVADDIGLPTSAPDSLRQLYRDLGIHAYVQHTLARSGAGLLLVAEGFATRNDSALFRVEAAISSVSELSEQSDLVIRGAADAFIDAAGRVPRPVVSGRLFGTTPEAAALYLEARQLLVQREHLRSADVSRRAIAADSTFALAWILLEAALGNGGLSEQERFVALTNAMRWRDRLTRRSSRAYVEVMVLRQRGDLTGALERAKDALREFPGETIITNALGNLYTSQRKFDVAARVYAGLHDAAIMARQGTPPVANYLTVLLDNKQIDEARRQIDRSRRAFGANASVVYLGRYVVASSLLQGDSLAAVGLEQLAAGSTADSLQGYLVLSHAMRLGGRIDSAFALERRRRAIVLQAQQVRVAVASVAQEAVLRAALQQDPSSATALLDSTLQALRWDTIPALDRAYDFVVQARISTGNLVAARRLVDEWRRTVPNEVATAQAPLIAVAEGELALAAGDGRTALARFRDADVGACISCSRMRLARAYDVLNQSDSVIYWYEQALGANVGRLASRPLEIPRAYRRLGELYEAKGDTKRAIQRYGDFVELWKNADPALQPLVKDVRERIARLQRKAG